MISLSNQFKTHPQGYSSDAYGSEITEAGIRELLKSMEANEGVTDVSQLTGASALQPQDLEASVISLLFDETYFKAMNRIPKVKAFSTLAEYTQRTSFGSYNKGGFVSQSENSRQSDPNFKRKTADIKFVREIWSVSSVLAASRTITNSEVEAVDAATMRGLETAERGFFYGNTEHVGEEWQGLDSIIETNALIDSGAIVDLKGNGISETVLKNVCKSIADRLGLVNDMYMSYNAQNEIDGILDSSTNQRFIQNAGNDALTFDLGRIINGFKATFAKDGRVTFIPNFFLNVEEEEVPLIETAGGLFVEGATSDMAPATPSFTLADTALGGVETTEWSQTSAAPSAVAYKYRIIAENHLGLSKAAEIKVVTPGDGKKIRITIKDNSPSNHATCYRIYREIKTGGGVIRFMKRIPKTGVDTIFDDFNFDLPGTTNIFIGDFNSRGMGPQRTCAMKELAGWHKTRYSIIGPFFWGATNYYATPVFYAPKKFIKIKNVGVGLF